jgi:hypothetical protein
VKEKEKSGVIQDVVIDREDRLELMLLNERRTRLQAERDKVAVQLENVEMQSQIRLSMITEKYGVNLEGKRIDLATGLVTGNLQEVTTGQ